MFSCSITFSCYPGDTGTNVSSRDSLPGHHQCLQQCPLPGTCMRIVVVTNKQNIARVPNCPGVTIFVRHHKDKEWQLKGKKEANIEKN